MEDGNRTVDLVLVWHMHQPDFRDCATGQFRLPWVYLHAVKDYADMAAHLERHPRVRAVVNWVPVLLDQLEDYADQFATGCLRDPLLAFLDAEDLDSLGPADRELLFDRCFRANHAKMIEPYPAYRRLLEFFRFAESQGGPGLDFLSGRYLADLLTWYHLAWTGETVRRDHAVVVELMAKGENFGVDERRALLGVIGRVVRDIIPRWRRLAERGQVEISSTPHYHPIGPLMLDFAAAHERRPGAPLPSHPRYPGGRQRLATQISWGLQSHAQRFGRAPVGIWPAEGAVSGPFVEMLGREGVAWTASGEAILAASLEVSGPLPPREQYLYRPWRIAATGVTGFFRDDRLSDAIGFEYSKWHGRDAAAHLAGALERIAMDAPGPEVPVVSIILDGENAWEYYPYNGFYFLDDLYATLESHPTIRTTTCAAVTAAGGARVGQLDRLVAGSWVYGDLATWIGSRDKNAAWDLLCEAKSSFDLVMASGRLTPEEQEAASRQLGVCEGSDWCWWFGDYNPPESVQAMDIVYRASLARLYELLKLTPPVVLSTPVSLGGARHADTVGAMRRAS
jgi:alpha-amylase/alpha-mannosidase (GH57 family)